MDTGKVVVFHRVPYRLEYDGDDSVGRAESFSKAVASRHDWIGSR